MTLSHELEEALDKGIQSTISKGYIDLSRLDMSGGGSVAPIVGQALEAAYKSRQTVFLMASDERITQSDLMQSIASMFSIMGRSKTPDEAAAVARYAKTMGSRVKSDRKVGKDGSMTLRVEFPESYATMLKSIADDVRGRR